MLWQTKSQREGLEIVVAVVQWLDVLLHFVLFVWACVDTNKRNRGKKVKDTQAIADRVIRDMEARGLITIHHPATVSADRPEMTQPGPETAQTGEIGVAR